MKPQTMHTLRAKLSTLCAESGQTMSEYVVILGVIVIVTVVAYTQLGDAIEAALNSMRATL